MCGSINSHVRTEDTMTDNQRDLFYTKEDIDRTWWAGTLTGITGTLIGVALALLWAFSRV